MGYTINIEGKGVFELAEPTFDIYALALRRLINKDGAFDPTNAGKVIFDGCYKNNNIPLEKIADDVKLYVSLCMKSSEILEVLQGDIKKK